MKYKKAVSTMTIMMIVALISFAIISATVIPTIRSHLNLINKNTDIINPSMSEDNMYNVIKKYSETGKYVDADELANEFILSYPNSRQIHDVYYMRLYALLQMAKFTEATKLLQDYIKLNKNYVNNFPERYAQSKALFRYIEFLAEDNNEGALNAIENELIDIGGPSLLGDNSNLVAGQDYLALDSFDTLIFPDMGVEVDKYPVKVDPMFLNLYWYVGLKSLEECSSFENSNVYTFSFDTIFENINLDNAEQMKLIYSRFNNLCDDGYIQASFISTERMLQNYNSNEPWNYLMESFAYELNLKYGGINKDFNQFVDYLGVVNQYLVLEQFQKNNRPIMGNDVYSQELGGYMDIVESIGDPEIDEYTTSYYMAHYSLGLLYLELGFSEMSLLCSEQADKLYDLFGHDGDLAQFKSDLSANGGLKACVEVTNSDDVKAKEYFAKAYSSFRNAYNIMARDVKKIAISETGYTEESLTPSEKNQYKVYVLPYYLQATLINDALNRDTFLYTKSLLNNVRADFCDIRTRWITVDDVSNAENVCGNGDVEGYIGEQCDGFDTFLCQDGWCNSECKCEYNDGSDILHGGLIGNNIDDSMLNDAMIVVDNNLDVLDDSINTFNPLTGRAVKSLSIIDISSCNSNGIREGDEQCDGDDNLRCNGYKCDNYCSCSGTPDIDDIVIDIIGCNNNGKREGNEQCDGFDADACLNPLLGLPGSCNYNCKCEYRIIQKYFSCSDTSFNMMLPEADPKFSGGVKKLVDNIMTSGKYNYLWTRDEFNFGAMYFFSFDSWTTNAGSTIFRGSEIFPYIEIIESRLDNIA